MTLISIIVLSIISEVHTAALNSENVNVYGAQMVDEGSIGSLSSAQNAFETIANVNSENGMLMRKTFETRIQDPAKNLQWKVFFENSIYEAQYSRMDQVKFVEDSL